MAWSGSEALGCLAIGVTNQPDVARGTQTRAEADALNRQVATAAGSTRWLPAITTMRTSARAASRAPACCVDAAARWQHRPRAVLHGGGPLARRRGRPARRVPDRLHRLLLSGGPARPTGRPDRPFPGGSRDLDRRSDQPRHACRSDAFCRCAFASSSSQTAQTVPACSRCTATRASRASPPTRR